MSFPAADMLPQEAHNEFDMLKGCINRSFVTHDVEELDRVTLAAYRYLNRLYDYNRRRIADEPIED